MKRCPRCGQTKSRDQFFRNKGRYDGLSGYCRPCQTRSNNDHAADVRQRAIEAIGGPVCRRCGEDDPVVITIDHIEGGGTQHRKRVVSTFRLYQDVLKEPSKYQPLCWNCQFRKKIENGEHGRRFIVTL